ncbi:MAG: methyltransferase domain-containing protein [Halobacteriovoraceae bacterium]|jgi:ubiquinone/menaquinone biosynthesis C-methylase UbiE|nr:methyltransferase domain-containing protein [Halobacteriovoraceae bacterium]
MPNASDFPYLHGFSKTEQDRLRTQAEFTEHVIYKDINFSGNTNILEVGCGVGAQSEILLRRFPKIQLTGIELNEKQIASATDYLKDFSFAKDRYELLKMDATQMSFDSNQFDGAFLCWVLEHVPNPKHALNEVRRVLKPGSTIYINEVMNSSFFLEPYSPHVWKYWMAFNDYQLDNAGDPFIGAKLGNLLLELGFKDIKTEVKTWHYDNRHPTQKSETIKFWTELLMSAKDQLIKEKVVSVELAQKAEQELAQVARNHDSVFFYSFMQASARVF